MTTRVARRWISAAALLAGCGSGAGGGAAVNPNAGKGVVGGTTCFPLCANASTDPDGDGFGFEQGASCVVAGTAQARTRLSCVPGQPLPTTKGPPAGSTGVVATDAAGTRVCVGVCSNDVADDGTGWGWEFEASCVIPGSATARTSVSCTIGQAVPTTVGPPPNSPGVVIDGASGRTCVGLCTIAATDDGTGFGYELGASCVIPGSVTAMASLPCRTGQPVPDVDLTGLPGRLVNEVCTPFCRTPGSDPDGDGWGYEVGLACLVRGSMAATAMGIDCTVGEDVLKPPAVLNPAPPAGGTPRPAGVASTGFFVAGGKLYDKFGSPFVIRGVNNLHIYFDNSNQYLAYQALDEIAALGVNTIRIVWLTTGSASNLARVVRRVVELKMIPMVELQDVTGGTTSDGLQTTAAYWARADVKPVLSAYQDFLLVNIANEWSGADFRNAYTTAIATLRAAGITHTLVIDANGNGQNADSVLTDGGPLLAADPQHNLLFSVHMYETYAATTAGRARITGTLAQAATASLPLVIGEFGWQAAGAPVDAALIMSECARLGVGYVAWSWKGNSTTLAYLDMAVDWPGQTLTDWGTTIIRGPNGIAATARRASVFAP